MKLKLIFLLGFICCNLFMFAQKEQAIADMKTRLAGNWQWQQTKICQRSNPDPETPESCKCTKRIMLNADGIIQVYINDALTSTSTYTVTTSKEGEGYFFKSDVMEGKIGVDENNLSISTCEIDGEDITYVKTY